MRTEVTHYSFILREIQLTDKDYCGATLLILSNHSWDFSLLLKAEYSFNFGLLTPPTLQRQNLDNLKLDMWIEARVN